MSAEKRGSARYDSLNLLHFALPNDETPEIEGMGRTLNVSQSGIMLETYEPIEPDQTIMLTIGIEEDLVMIEGRTVHCHPAGAGRYTTGVRFLEMSDEARQVLTRYIQLFGQR